MQLRPRGSTARRLPPPARRRVALALAAAEHRVLHAHAGAAAAFLREVGSDLAPERALSIYFRLLAIPRQDHRPVAVAALARIARRPPAPPPEPPHAAGLAARLLHRLRGRTRHRLRARVAAAAARARSSVRRAHADGATSVVAATAGVLAPAEAVQLYVEALRLPHGWAETVFHDAIAADPAAA